MRLRALAGRIGLVAGDSLTQRYSAASLQEICDDVLRHVNDAESLLDSYLTDMKPSCLFRCEPLVKMKLCLQKPLGDMADQLWWEIHGVDKLTTEARDHIVSARLTVGEIRSISTSPDYPQSGDRLAILVKKLHNHCLLSFDLIDDLPRSQVPW